MLQITKPARAPQRVVIGAKVPQEMKAQLERAAKAHSVSVSVLIEQALAHVLDLLEKQDASKSMQLHKNKVQLQKLHPRKNAVDREKEQNND